VYSRRSESFADLTFFIEVLLSPGSLSRIDQADDTASVRMSNEQDSSAGGPSDDEPPHFAERVIRISTGQGMVIEEDRHGLLK